MRRPQLPRPSPLRPSRCPVFPFSWAQLAAGKVGNFAACCGANKQGEKRGSGLGVQTLRCVAASNEGRGICQIYVLGLSNCCWFHSQLKRGRGGEGGGKAGLRWSPGVAEQPRKPYLAAASTRTCLSLSSLRRPGSRHVASLPAPRQ